MIKSFLSLNNSLYFLGGAMLTAPIAFASTYFSVLDNEHREQIQTIRVSKKDKLIPLVGKINKLTNKLKLDFKDNWQVSLNNAEKYKKEAFDLYREIYLLDWKYKNEDARRYFSNYSFRLKRIIELGLNGHLRDIKEKNVSRNKVSSEYENFDIDVVWSKITSDNAYENILSVYKNLFPAINISENLKKVILGS